MSKAHVVLASGVISVLSLQNNDLGVGALRVGRDGVHLRADLGQLALQAAVAYARVGVVSFPDAYGEVAPETTVRLLRRVVELHSREETADWMVGHPAVEVVEVSLLEADTHRLFEDVDDMVRPRSGSRFRVGRTRVTCSATDTSANTRKATFTVTVKPRR